MKTNTDSATADSPPNTTSLERRSQRSAAIRSAHKHLNLGSGSAKRTAGRPSTYTDAIAQEICVRIAHGESMKSVLLTKGMPPSTTVSGWLMNRDDFRALHARARAQQACVIVDQMRDLARTEPERHPITGAIDPASVQHIRVMLETAQWLAERLNPRAFGTRVGLDHGGNVNITVVTGVPDAIARKEFVGE